MKLDSVRKLKVWKYTYDSKAEKVQHMNYMLSAQFEIINEGVLWIEFSQTI